MVLAHYAPFLLLAEFLGMLTILVNGIYSGFSKPVEPDRLFDCLPNSLRPSSASPGHQSDASSKIHSEHHKSLETAVYTPPTLIPPRVLPLLHDLAQQMVQSGNQQQLFRTYR